MPKGTSTTARYVFKFVTDVGGSVQDLKNLNQSLQEVFKAAGGSVNVAGLDMMLTKMKDLNMELAPMAMHWKAVRDNVSSFLSSTVDIAARMETMVRTSSIYLNGLGDTIYNIFAVKMPKAASIGSQLIVGGSIIPEMVAMIEHQINKLEKSFKDANIAGALKAQFKDAAAVPFDPAVAKGLQGLTESQSGMTEQYAGAISVLRLQVVELAKVFKALGFEFADLNKWRDFNKQLNLKDLATDIANVIGAFRGRGGEEALAGAMLQINEKRIKANMELASTMGILDAQRQAGNELSKEELANQAKLTRQIQVLDEHYRRFQKASAQVAMGLFSKEGASSIELLTANMIKLAESVQNVSKGALAGGKIIDIKALITGDMNKGDLDRLKQFGEMSRLAMLAIERVRAVMVASGREDWLSGFIDAADKGKASWQDFLGVLANRGPAASQELLNMAMNYDKIIVAAQEFRKLAMSSKMEKQGPTGGPQPVWALFSKSQGGAAAENINESAKALNVMLKSLQEFGRLTKTDNPLLQQLMTLRLQSFGSKNTVPIDDMITALQGLQRQQQTLKDSGVSVQGFAKEIENMLASLGRLKTPEVEERKVLAEMGIAYSEATAGARGYTVVSRDMIETIKKQVMALNEQARAQKITGQEYDARMAQMRSAYQNAPDEFRIGTKAATRQGLEQSVQTVLQTFMKLRTEPAEDMRAGMEKVLTEVTAKVPAIRTLLRSLLAPGVSAAGLERVAGAGVKVEDIQGTLKAISSRTMLQKDEVAVVKNLYQAYSDATGADIVTRQQAIRDSAEKQGISYERLYLVVRKLAEAQRGLGDIDPTKMKHLAEAMSPEVFLTPKIQGLHQAVLDIKAMSDAMRTSEAAQKMRDLGLSLKETLQYIDVYGTAKMTMDLIPVLTRNMGAFEKQTITIEMAVRAMQSLGQPQAVTTANAATLNNLLIEQGTSLEKIAALADRVGSALPPAFAGPVAALQQFAAIQKQVDLAAVVNQVRQLMADLSKKGGSNVGSVFQSIAEFVKESGQSLPAVIKLIREADKAQADALSKKYLGDFSSAWIKTAVTLDQVVNLMRQMGGATGGALKPEAFDQISVAAQQAGQSVDSLARMARVLLATDQNLNQALKEQYQLFIKLAESRKPEGMYKEQIKQIDQLLQTLSKVNDAKERARIADEALLKMGIRSIDEPFMKELNRITSQAYWARRMGTALTTVGSSMTMATSQYVQELEKAVDAYTELNKSATRAGSAMEAPPVLMGRLAGEIQRLSVSSKYFTTEQIGEGLRLWAAGTGEAITSLEQLNRTFENTVKIQRLAINNAADLSEAITYVGAVISEFNLDVSDTNRVVDTLNYVAAKSFASLSDVGTTFREIGPIAAEVGVSIEELASATSILADEGIRGTKSGRAQRQLFIQLLKPTQQANDAMNDALGLSKELGITWETMAFPGGKFIGLANYIDLLAKTTENYTEQERAGLLAQIATANELPALTALVSAQIRARAQGINVIRAYEKIQKGIVDAEVRQYAELYQQSTGMKLSLESATQAMERMNEQRLASDEATSQEIERRWEAVYQNLGKAAKESILPVRDYLSEMALEASKAASTMRATVGATYAVAAGVQKLGEGAQTLGNITRLFEVFIMFRYGAPVLMQWATKAGMAVGATKELAGTLTAAGAGISRFVNIIGLAAIALQALDEHLARTARLKKYEADEWTTSRKEMEAYAQALKGIQWDDRKILGMVTGLEGRATAARLLYTTNETLAKTLVAEGWSLEKVQKALVGVRFDDTKARLVMEYMKGSADATLETADEAKRFIDIMVNGVQVISDGSEGAVKKAEDFRKKWGLAVREVGDAAQQIKVPDIKQALGNLETMRLRNLGQDVQGAVVGFEDLIAKVKQLPAIGFMDIGNLPAELQQQFKDFITMRVDLSKQIESIDKDLAASIAQTTRDLNKDIAAAEKEGYDDRLGSFKNFAKRRVDEERGYQTALRIEQMSLSDAMYDIEYEYGQRLREMDQNDYDQRLEAARSYGQSLSDMRVQEVREDARTRAEMGREDWRSQRTLLEQRADLFEDYQKRIIEVQKEAHKNLEKLEHDHATKMIDLIETRDVRAIYKEQRDYRDQRSEMMKQSKEQIAKEKETLAERLKEMDKAEAKRLRDLKEDREWTRKLLDEDRKLRREDMARDFGRQMSELTRNLEKEKQAERDSYYDRRIDAIGANQKRIDDMKSQHILKMGEMNLELTDELTAQEEATNKKIDDRKREYEANKMYNELELEDNKAKLLREQIQELQFKARALALTPGVPPEDIRALESQIKAYEKMLADLNVSIPELEKAADAYTKKRAGDYKSDAEKLLADAEAKAKAATPGAIAPGAEYPPSYYGQPMPQPPEDFWRRFGEAPIVPTVSQDVTIYINQYGRLTEADQQWVFKTADDAAQKVFNGNVAVARATRNGRPY